MPHSINAPTTCTLGVYKIAGRALNADYHVIGTIPAGSSSSSISLLSEHISLYQIQIQLTSTSYLPFGTYKIDVNGGIWGIVF